MPLGASHQNKPTKRRRSIRQWNCQFECEGDGKNFATPASTGDNIAIAKAKAGYEHTEVDVIDLLGEAPKTRNPVDKNEDLPRGKSRKVVNAVCRVYGKPDVIRIEMARELKLTKKEKEEVERQNKRNKVLNDEAREKIKEAGLFRGVEPSKADLVKYQLWVESDEHCPYPPPRSPLHSYSAEKLTSSTSFPIPKA